MPYLRLEATPMVRPTREMIGQRLPSTWTVDEYELLPADDGLRYEILAGELVMTPAPSTKHQRISRHLQFILYQALEPTGRGEVFDAPFDVQLSHTTLVEPDLVVVLAQTAPRLTEQRLVGAPDVVVEILSPSTAPRDLQTKHRLYAQHGIAHYWVIDPERETLTEYVLDGDRYQLTNVVEEEEDFVPRAFPELRIPLRAIFRGPAPR